MSYPRIETLLNDDSILFLITDPRVLGKEMNEDMNREALVLPRSELFEFRKIFLKTYNTLKYRFSTLFHFKLLYKYRVKNLSGIILPENWDLSMDRVLIKNFGVTDRDRKILMPSSWVLSASHCEKAFANSQFMTQDPDLNLFPNFIHH